jgi:hypothetical protein
MATQLTEINEGTTAYFTAVFKDKDGNNAAPTSAEYLIYCVTTSEITVEWTNIPTPSASQEITISGSTNVMQNEGNDYEDYVLMVKGTYGAGDTVTEPYEYRILNMYGV